jgi:hypothetical protein
VEARDLLHVEERTRLERLLLILAVNGGPKPVGEIKKIGVSCGLRTLSEWNLSDILRRSNGQAILTDDGWELTRHGSQAVARMANIRVPSAVVKKTVADVRKSYAQTNKKK